MSNAQEHIDKLNQEAENQTEVATPADIPEGKAEAIRTKEGDPVRRVVVDRQACIGAQSCVVVADGLFKMDDKNLAYIDDPNAYDEDMMLMAAQSCPVLAIHLYDKEGKKIFPEV
ncbi:ferredoxin [Patescibacteria group bacterium]|nr:ferredoxin [Patescibacteria group bacterium]MBU1721810.1 ferredoxin [Patescibacteria group bacterium]MBU1901696.1 ferredoxin [Patescibacteria group bacterium]